MHDGAEGLSSFLGSEFELLCERSSKKVDTRQRMVLVDVYEGWEGGDVLLVMGIPVDL